MKSIVLLFILPFIVLLTTAVTNHTTAPVFIKKDAKKLAEYYRQRVLRGESMASVVKLYSEDTGSATNGGLINGVVKGMMVPEFENVAFSLKPGDISEVFETKFGFHFIQLVSRKGESLSLRHLLITRE